MALDDVFDLTDARIEPSDVLGGGFLTELDEEDISEYVIKSHHYIEEVLVGYGVSDETLTLIELDLTRHLVKFGPERQVDSEGSGPSSRDYSGDFTKEALGATTWGQSAMDRDPTNRLGRFRIKFRTVGGKDNREPTGREYF